MPGLVRALRERWAVSMVGFIAAGLATEARAQTRDACLESYDVSQRLRQAGKLVTAREKLLVCVLPTCPELVRKDCDGWLHEVERAISSVVIRARDPQLRDAVDVKVWMDDTLFLDHLDGRSKPIDPGVHAFRYEMAGMPRIQERIVIAEGEKGRIVSVNFAAPRVESTSSTSTRAPLGYLLAGLGVAGLGGFSYFGWSGLSDRNALRDTCYPNCSVPSVDHVRGQFLIADVSLGVGLVSLGVGSWLLLTPSSRPAPAARLEVTPRSGGLAATFRTTF